MAAVPADQVDVALAVAQLLKGNIGRIRAIEGHILRHSADGSPITPSGIASDFGLTLMVSRDLCRQLESADAAARTRTPVDPQSTEYECNPDRCLSVLETAVTATRILQQDRERREPFPSVEPVATLPADPSFSGITPQDIGFEWLMPSLSTEINRSTSEIIILMPFFEQDGFERLQPDLMAALDRGVSITIVTRYLSDSGSHNHEVLADFAKALHGEGISLSDLRLIEYAEPTAGKEGAEQSGPPPEFTLHAKVMVFDDEAVYIGSANVTDYGFDRYLELGVILRGPPVRQYRKLCDSLLGSDAAQGVDLQELR